MQRSKEQVQHWGNGGTVISTVASQQGGPGFESTGQPGPAPSHSSKAGMLG